MNPNQIAINVHGLTKKFGALTAVSELNFAVQPGEIFSLLGPNGAGKSTTISILSGLFQPNSGDAEIFGHSVTHQSLAARAELGVVPQDVALYLDLTARENLMFWGKMYGLRGAVLHQRVNEVLELITLTDRQHSCVGTFSGGMKRRVNIGAALLHQPKIIIMDEPTVGIDPQSRRSILDGVKELNRRGMTVIYTTHYMEEAEELSHRIGIMDHGQMIACGTNRELLKLVGEQTRMTLSLNTEGQAAARAWEQIEGVTRTYSEDGHVVVLAQDSNAVLPRLFETANQAGFRIMGVDIQEPNLETVFLHLTGRALRD